MRKVLFCFAVCVLMGCSSGCSGAPESAVAIGQVQPTSSKEMDEVTDRLVSQLILEKQLDKEVGERTIEALVLIPDLSLAERLARGWALSVFVKAGWELQTDQRFKEHLATTGRVETMANRSAALRVAGFMDSYVKSAAMNANAEEAVGGWVALRNKIEIDLNTSVTAPMAATIAGLVSILESMDSGELAESRRQLKDSVRRALNANPDALRSLIQASQLAKQGATPELRTSRQRVATLISAAKRK